MKRKKKAVAVPTREAIIEIVKEYEPIKSDSIFVRTGLLTKFPYTKDIITRRAMLDILKDTQDSEEIADRVLDLFPKEKPGRMVRIDAGVTVKKRVSKKYKGRAKDSAYELFRRVEHIFSAENIRFWKEKFGMNVIDTFLLQGELLSGQVVFPSIERKYSDEARARMGEELRTLGDLLKVFGERRAEAKKKNDKYFLRLVSSFFGEDGPGANSTRGRAYKRDKVMDRAAKERYTNYLRGKKVKAMNLHTRDKAVFLVKLASMAWYTIRSAEKWKHDRDRAITTIRSHMQMYAIHLREVFPPQDRTDYIHKLIGTPDQDLIEWVLNRDKQPV